jgi:type I restriction enzyme, S subunit
VSAESLLRELERACSTPEAVRLIRPWIVQVALRGELTADGRTAATRRPISAAQIASGMAELLSDRPSYRWRPDASGGIHAPQQVPDGWTHACLNGTGLFINGLAFKPTDWGTTGRPIIRIQNLSGQNPTFNFTHRVVSPDNIVKDGDLVVSWSATLDTFVWRGPEGVLNQHIFKVIPNREAVTTGFLYWLLKHEVRQLAQSQHAHGLAMMHINRGPFLAHGVLLPPLAEQCRIVAKVDELMARCDELEAAQTHREARRDRLRATTLRNLVAPEEPKENARFFLRHSARMITSPEHVAGVRQAILDLAVRGRILPQDPTEEPASDLLREIQSRDAHPGRLAEPRGPGGDATFAPKPLPPGWMWINVSQAFRVTGGIQKQPMRLPRENAWPYLGVSNVQRGRLDLRNVARFELFPGELEKLRLEPGDLLIVEGNGSPNEIGRCARWNGEIPDCVHQNHIIRCRPLRPGLDHFGLLYLNSPSGTATMQELAITSAGLYSLSVGKIRRITVPLPPLAEQHRIVAKVDELMAVCDELEQSLATEQTERARLLEALLHDALEDALPARELELSGPQYRMW